MAEIFKCQLCEKLVNEEPIAVKFALGSSGFACGKCVAALCEPEPEESFGTYYYWLKNAAPSVEEEAA